MVRNSLDRTNRILYYWVPVVLYAGFIVYLSSQPFPSEQMPKLFEVVNDKLLHALEYGVLGILCYRAFHFASGSKLRPFASILAILVAMMFGVTDEFHQYFIPSREADGWDWIADTIGAIISIKIYEWWVEALPIIAR